MLNCCDSEFPELPPDDLNFGTELFKNLLMGTQQVYFSIGEAIAALSVTLVIPQFLKPIYRFRLQVQSIRLEHIYIAVFLGTIFVFSSNVVANLEINSASVISNSSFWQILGGFFFLLAFSALISVVFWVPKIRPARYPKYVKTAAAFLAHANLEDQADFSKDILGNIERIIRTAAFGSFNDDPSAFYIFRYRRKIEDANYARLLLQIFNEPQLCELLVHRCPWDTVAILRTISDKRLNNISAEGFVREIGRQAIVSPASMMVREIEYKGFYVAPVLSGGVFGDHFINRYYEPIRGLEYADFKNVNQNTIARMMRGYKSTLETVFEHREYWESHCLFSIGEHFRWLADDIRIQVNSFNGGYGLVTKLHFGLVDIIKLTVENLKNIDPKTYESLYAKQDEKRDFTLLDFVSEAIVEVMFSCSNDFAGFEDPFWSVVLKIMQDVFERDDDSQNGMDPLQQRVAIKVVDKVRQNMDGYFPAVTRILLSVFGSYPDVMAPNPNSASALFKEAFYYEMKKYPDLFRKDPSKARKYLPSDVHYDASRSSFVKRFRFGDEVITDIDAISPRMISFFDAKRRLELC